MEVLNDMHRWVQQELYDELRAMPLWTLSAFGSISSGEVLKNSDPRIQLIRHLVEKHMERSECPYDIDHRNSYKVSQYIQAVKAAVIQCRLALAPAPATVPV
jgi:hypothetical protein